MNRPSPAIVSEEAVRRLPRFALILLCIAYVGFGFFARDPWKSADMMALGYMLELVDGRSSWLLPQILGTSERPSALLPYWLGALAIQFGASWLEPAFASRIPFALLLTMALACTWYASYFLARRPEAQPVAFAFGGEASPVDYARAIADGALLAVVACLGLAQLSHETTPALAQLAFIAAALLGMSALSYRPILGTIFLCLGLAGLALSGAPFIGLLLGLIFLTYRLIALRASGQLDWREIVAPLLACLLVLALATGLDLWHWQLRDFDGIARDGRSFGRLVLWFTWPAWPLALWTVWRWKRHLTSLHIGLPCLLVLLVLGATAFSGGSDRTLLLALPPLATLAAFALPTLKRGVGAFIDWFTLLFFSGCAIIIWTYWVAMQSGTPRRMASSVAKLVPGFEPSFQTLPFLFALAATLTWLGLVRWRVGRHPRAIWKSLVLPASGATLCWLLLMTLWLPMLDFARSYKSMVLRVASITGQRDCLQIHGLTPAQVGAFRFHGKLELRPAARQPDCPWLLADVDDLEGLKLKVDLEQWFRRGTFRRPSDRNEDVILFERSRP